MDRGLIIAGGGIGGMATALALHRAGLEFTLYERAPAFGEVGAGISLWPNATAVLKPLGVLDRVLELGERVVQFDLRRPDGSLLGSMAADRLPTPALCLHRADLHRALREALPPDRLRSGYRLLSFAQGGGSVVVRFAEGLEVRGAGLVGADGINSAVRFQFHGTSEPDYRGYRIWRGHAPDLGGCARGHSSETWGAGRRFGIMPLGRGRICWYATRNGPAGAPDIPERRLAEIRALFQGWHHPIPELIEATSASDIVRSDACDRPALRRWGQGPVTLLGDAAHPVTPNLGQGACLAIEDAACLAQALRDSGDAAAAFRRYEARRRARSAFIGRRARQIGWIGQRQHPALTLGRNVLAQVVLAWFADMRHNPIYANDG